MRPALPILIVIVMAACGQQSGLKQVNVATTMTVDGASCGFICDGPDTCPLDCGGAIGIFALDPTAPDGQEILDSDCVTFAPNAGDTLRELSAHLSGVSFNFPEGTTMALEIIVYPGAEEGCPLVPFDGTFWGTTPAGAVPRYAGRSAVKTLSGDNVTFELPIGCPFFFAECPSSTPQIDAYVRDLTNLTSLSFDDAASFDVHAAQLYNPDSTPPLSAALSPVADLQLQSGADAVFRATSDIGFAFTPDCVGTIVTRIPGPGVSTASCESSIFDETHILAQSYYIDQQHIQDVLTYFGQSSLPSGGLLIGRITDTGTPTNLLTVRPQTGAVVGPITYFEEDVSGHLVQRTAGSWFAVQDAALAPPDAMQDVRCCEYFDAVDDQDRVVGTSFGRVGLIDGVVMGTEITRTFTFP